MISPPMYTSIPVWDCETDAYSTRARIFGQDGNGYYFGYTYDTDAPNTGKYFRAFLWDSKGKMVASSSEYITSLNLILDEEDEAALEEWENVVSEVSKHVSTKFNFITYDKADGVCVWENKPVFEPLIEGGGLWEENCYSVDSSVLNIELELFDLEVPENLEPEDSLMKLRKKD